MNSPDVTRHCVAICQLSGEPQEDFNVNTELLVLEDGEVHVSTWDAEPRDGGFDVHVLNDRVDALGFMVVTDWEFFDEKAYAVVERRPGTYRSPHKRGSLDASRTRSSSRGEGRNPSSVHRTELYCRRYPWAAATFPSSRQMSMRTACTDSRSGSMALARRAASIASGYRPRFRSRTASASNACSWT